MFSYKTSIKKEKDYIKTDLNLFGHWQSLKESEATEPVFLKDEHSVLSPLGLRLFFFLYTMITIFLGTIFCLIAAE